MVAIDRVSTMQLFVREAIVWLLFYFPTDGANWWSRKYYQWAVWCLRTWNNTYTISKKDLAESISVVPAKYPPKVKLELFSQL